LPNFQIKAGTVTFDLHSIDDVLKTIKENDLKIDEITILKIVTEDLTSLVSGLLKPESIMEKLRTTSRKENSLKQFDSPFLDNDWELPYEFDLLFDIKSEGHIAYKLSSDGYLSDELEEAALRYGLSDEYLKGLL